MSINNRSHHCNMSPAGYEPGWWVLLKGFSFCHYLRFSAGAEEAKIETQHSPQGRRNHTRHFALQSLKHWLCGWERIRLQLKKVRRRNRNNKQQHTGFCGGEEALNCISAAAFMFIHTHRPINSWLLSCRWMWPSAGASCVVGGSSSSRSDASFTLRSARMRCHLLSFSGELLLTETSNGPLPTSKEKRTSLEAVWGKKGYQGLV